MMFLCSFFFFFGPLELTAHFQRAMLFCSALHCIKNDTLQRCFKTREAASQPQLCFHFAIWKITTILCTFPKRTYILFSHQCTHPPSHTFSTQKQFSRRIIHTNKPLKCNNNTYCQYKTSHHSLTGKANKQTAAKTENNSSKGCLDNKEVVVFLQRTNELV